MEEVGVKELNLQTPPPAPGSEKREARGVAGCGEGRQGAEGECVCGARTWMRLPGSLKFK